MDYLVFGVGFGSTLVLLGWALRQFGPALRYRDAPDDVLGAEQLLERNDWQRFCIAMGALLSVCGAVMLLVTLITLLIRPADRTGTIIVGVIFALSLLAVAAWIVMYVNQHRALSGDRRIEAVAATRTRNIAGAPTVSGNAATAVPAAKVARQTPTKANVAGQDDAGRRREAVVAPQQQRAASEVAESTAEAAPVRSDQLAARPARPATETSPAQPDAEATSPTYVADSETRPATGATTPGPDPTQVLRGLQFKRSGTHRREDAPTPSTTGQPATRIAPATQGVEDNNTDARSEKPRSPDREA